MFRSLHIFYIEDNTRFGWGVWDRLDKPSVLQHFKQLCGNFSIFQNFETLLENSGSMHSSDMSIRGGDMKCMGLDNWNPS